MKKEEVKKYIRFLKLGGAAKTDAMTVLESIVKSNGQLSIDEVYPILESVFTENVEQRLSDRVTEYIENGQFTDINLTLLDKDCGIRTQTDRDNRQKIMTRLRDRGVVEQVGHGKYRKPSPDCPEIDLENCDPNNTVDVKLPFGLHNWQVFYPKNIIIFAGDTDAGKSALGINILRLNQDSKLPLKIFNSEMGAEEILKRFNNAGIDKRKYKIYERDQDFSEVLNPNAINLIDYLELTKEHYLIAEEFKRATAKLKKGIAIYLIQKKFGSEMGYGAEASMWKARLYCTMDYDKKNNSGKLTVRKGKNPKVEGVNIKGWEWEYTLNKGTDFCIISEPEGIIKEDEVF